jgi:hypothetical protein
MSCTTAATPTITMINARERMVPLMPAGFLIIPKTAQNKAERIANTMRKYPHTRFMLIAASEPPVAIA